MRSIEPGISRATISRFRVRVFDAPRNDTVEGISMSANNAIHIAVLPGDGIGPEVLAPALEILKRIEATTPSLKFRFTEAAAGANHYRETRKSMPDSTIKLCEEADAILLVLRPICPVLQHHCVPRC